MNIDETKGISFGPKCGLDPRGSPLCERRGSIRDQHGLWGIQRSTRHMIRMRAKELMLAGDNISPEEANKMDLVNKVVDPEHPMG